MRNYFARFTLAVLSVVMLGGGFCFADDYVVPVQKIEVNSGVGGGTVPLGEVVELSLSKIDKQPEFMTKLYVTWKVFDGGKEKFFKKDGDSIYFGTGIVSRTVQVFASVSYLYVNKDVIEVRNNLLTYNVKIGDVGPDPGPNPNPNPPRPDPVFPDGKYKLSAFIYQLSKSRDVKESQALAASFKGMGAKVVAVNMTIADFLKESLAANKAALVAVGVDPAGWDSISTALQEKIYGLYKDGSLRSKEDFRDAWNEIATGLGGK